MVKNDSFDELYDKVKELSARIDTLEELVALLLNITQGSEN